ncbi:MAG: glutamate mutase L [bacterium]|nr:glutamate mutase L [bacterium]
MINSFDIGSTTTKLISFREENGKLTGIENNGRTPTTVELPDNNVSVGLTNLISKFNLSIDSKNTFITSSAGGGLKILVVALTSIISGFSAVRATDVSGGIVLDKISIDSPVSKVEKIQRIIQASPDLILFIGGLEDGEISKIVELFYILSYAKPKNYITTEKIPLIYAGNSKAHGYLKEILEKDYEIFIEGNIRPSLLKENISEVKALIQDLFTNHVMKIAPGFEHIKEYTSNQILPTPLAVEEYLNYFYNREKKNLLSIDIGGATTDIFSIFEGKMNRTVAANLGMSFNAGNIYSDSDSEFVNNFFGYTVDLELFKDYIWNKNCNPFHVPKNPDEKNAEMILTSLALKKAMDLHFQKYFKPVHMAITLDGYREVEVLRQLQTFDKMDTERVILSGGIFTALSKEDAMKVISNAFGNNAELEVFKDNLFILPHLGNIKRNSDLDFSEIESENIEFCGNLRKFRKSLKANKNLGKNYLLITPENINESEITIYEKGKKPGGLNLSNGLFLNNIDSPELKSGILKIENTFTASAELNESFIFRFFHGFPYQVKVKTGDKIKPRTVLASTPEIINEMNTKALHVKADEEVKYLMKEKEIFTHTNVIFEKHPTDALSFRGKSRFSFEFRGVIEKIDSVNHIIIFSREIDNFKGLKTIKPEQLFPDLKKAFAKKFRKGYIIYRDQVICKSESGEFKSPYSGKITEFNEKTGEIILSPVYQYDDIICYPQGEVVGITPNRIDVKVMGKVIIGKIGVGKPAFGTAVPMTGNLKGKPEETIVVINKDAEITDLKKMIRNGFLKFIFPEITYSIFESIKTEEGISAIVLEGFGITERESEYLKQMYGNEIYLNPLTQLRAGIIRPAIVITK